MEIRVPAKEENKKQIISRWDLHPREETAKEEV